MAWVCTIVSNIMNYVYTFYEVTWYRHINLVLQYSYKYISCLNYRPITKKYITNYYQMRIQVAMPSVFGVAIFLILNWLKISKCHFTRNCISIAIIAQLFLQWQPLFSFSNILKYSLWLHCKNKEGCNLVHTYGISKFAFF